MKYSIRELNYIWLDCFDFLSYGKKTLIHEMYNIDEDLRDQIVEYTNELRQIMDNEEYNKIKLSAREDYLDNVLSSYDSQGVIVITSMSENYPALLRETDNPPFVLYCKGNIDLLNTRCLAVVGTRRPTEYGRITTRQFVNAIASKGITIVSGLAHGVDTIAHEAALHAGGHTIAVLAGGFNNIYPSSNQQLANRIVKDDLLICENRPDCVALGYMFPIRNRILAGISEGVLITEAMENSGSLHTKTYAVDYGRELYVVPGRIDSIESRGNNKVLREMQGAIVLEPEDILIDMQISIDDDEEDNNIKQLDMEESAIIRYITGEKRSYQEILDMTGMTPQRLNTMLLSMQIRGLVEKIAGNYYIAT